MTAHFLKGAGDSPDADFLPPVAVPEFPATALADGDLILPAAFPAVLDAGQIQEIRAALEACRFSELALSEIAQLGSQAEMALHGTLGRFLDRIEKNQHPRIFRLVEELREAVDQEALPELAERILHGRPGVMERLVGVFSRKALREAVDRGREEVRQLLASRSRTLCDRIAGMERELRQEQQRLETEIRALEELGKHYRQHFVAFAQTCVFLASLLARARLELQQEEAASPRDPMDLQALRDKVLALESRALAVEGAMSRLPADQLLIRQLQGAGLSTLQETSGTAAARFASIKMTLLTIHAALATQGVQRLAQQGAELDRNLQEVRSRLMRDVAGRAAFAPGENRLAQAQQLSAIVEETRALVALADQAREGNARKFQEARETFARARADIARLGLAVRPDRALSL